MDAEGRTWPVTIVAAWYAVFCTVACGYYGWQDLRATGAVISPAVQLLCLGGALSGGLYFFHAKLGHRLLLGLAILTILAIGTSDAKATMFHLVVLIVLLVPLLGSRSRPMPGGQADLSGS